MIKLLKQMEFQNLHLRVKNYLIKLIIYANKFLTGNLKMKTQFTNTFQKTSDHSRQQLTLMTQKEKCLKENRK